MIHQLLKAKIERVLTSGASLHKLMKAKIERVLMKAKIERVHRDGALVFLEFCSQACQSTQASRFVLAILIVACAGGAKHCIGCYGQDWSLGGSDLDVDAQEWTSARMNRRVDGRVDERVEWTKGRSGVHVSTDSRKHDEWTDSRTCLKLWNGRLYHNAYSLHVT